MKYGSFDVGIKNLAITILEKKDNKPVTHLNKIINIYKDKFEDLTCCENFKPKKRKQSDICKEFVKDGSGKCHCGKKAIYLWKDTENVCNKHKNQLVKEEANNNMIINKCTNKPLYYIKKDIMYGYCGSHKKKYKIDDLDKNYIKSDGSPCTFVFPKKQTQCMKKSKYQCNNNYYCNAHKKSVIKSETKKLQLIKIKKKKCTDVDLSILAKNMHEELDKIPELFQTDGILIENQPALTNPTMKSIGSILFGYCVYKSKDTQCKKVVFRSADNKLKVNKEKTKSELAKCKTSKEKYDKRKSLAEEYFLERIECSEIKKKFNESKKKDDLADSWLQAYYELKFII